MCRFIESICSIDGELFHLPYHQQRVDRTFRTFFKRTPHDLSAILGEVPDRGKHKCRVVYSENHCQVTYHAYQPRHIGSLQVVESTTIDYTYKSEDREALTRLYEYRGQADDVLIVKNGKCTDSYFANLAFYDGKSWLTPDTPLLEGVRRQALLDCGQLVAAPIAVGDIRQFEKVSLINAMLDLGEVSVPVSSISFG